MVKLKKLTSAGIFTALSVVLSAFYIPVGASKCFPVQHAVNVIAGVLLGPWYAVAMAFCTSLIRNLLGTGSLLAFPGSMIGAALCGLCYKYGKKLWLAFLGEVIGTGVIGGIAAYPVAAYLMSKQAALFAYVLPFIVSSFGGALISVIFIYALEKTKVLDMIKTAIPANGK